MPRQLQLGFPALIGLSVSLALLAAGAAACDGGDTGDERAADAVVDGSPGDGGEMSTDGPRVVPDAVVGEECMRDDDCGSGRLCDPYRTVCTPECSTEMDCPSWVYCVLRPGRGGRICTPRPPGDVYSIQFAGDECSAGAARCEQTVSVGTSVTLRVRVRAGETAVENANVEFTIADDGGTDVGFAESTATTDADGVATNELQVGESVGVADVQAGVPEGDPVTWKIDIREQ